jgi:bifunctional ADP-heptose synthase (sugar kinase/adenylyltransferase)
MKVLCIGDSCTDKFVYGKVERLNPEAPTPVFKSSHYISNPGMCGNVANHLKNLNIDYDFITHEEKITKTRFCDSVSNYILLRVDEEPEIKSLPPLINFKDYDLIIISDYNKGFLKEDYIKYMINEAYSLGKNTFLDTKKVLGEWSKNAWIKINEKEYDFNVKNGAIFNKEKLIVTLGSRGAMYKDIIYKPDQEIEVRSVVGAGDTYLVFFALSYDFTKNIEFSLKEGNRFAGIACAHKGVISNFNDYINDSEFIKGLG